MNRKIFAAAAACAAVLFAGSAQAALAVCSDADISPNAMACVGFLSGNLLSNSPGDITAQTKRVMQNISAVLQAAGLTFDHVVKTTIFLSDFADFQTVNGIYGSYFKKDPPARSTVQAAALPRNAKVEIEVIAVDAAGAGVASDTSG